MHNMLQFVLRRATRDERGAELVEWAMWVGAIAFGTVAAGKLLAPALVIAMGHITAMFP